MEKSVSKRQNDVTVLYLDFYGGLLTDKQAEILNSYFNEDYSLSEIAKGLGISRQAAHDAVRHGIRALAEYEDKLGLVRAYHNEMQYADEARAALADMRAVITDMKSTAGIKPEADSKGGLIPEYAEKLDGIARRMERQYIKN